MRKHLLSATAFSLLLAGPAWAGNATAPSNSESITGTSVAQAQKSAPQGAMMDEQQLEKYLNQQGFTSVQMIKLMGDTYEARAFKNGQNLAIEVDARTGKILAQDPAPRD
jgi:uncharacterized membrane protein YkoI